MKLSQCAKFTHLADDTLMKTDCKVSETYYNSRHTEKLLGCKKKKDKLFLFMMGYSLNRTTNVNHSLFGGSKYSLVEALSQ